MQIVHFPASGAHSWSAGFQSPWVSSLSDSGSHNTYSLSHRLSLAPTPYLLLSLVILPQSWHLHYAATSLQLSLQLHQRPPLVSQSVRSQFLSRTLSVLQLLCGPNQHPVGYLHMIKFCFQLEMQPWPLWITVFVCWSWGRFHLNKFWSLANQSQLIFEPQQTSTHCSSKANVSLPLNLNGKFHTIDQSRDSLCFLLKLLHNPHLHRLRFSEHSYLSSSHRRAH